MNTARNVRMLSNTAAYVVVSGSCAFMCGERSKLSAVAACGGWQTSEKGCLCGDNSSKSGRYQQFSSEATLVIVVI